MHNGLLEGNLLSRKSDYLQTLHELKESFDGEVKDAEARRPDEDAFLDAIVAVEERAGRDFKAIGTQIDQDELLTFLEKDELGQETGRIQGEVLTHIEGGGRPLRAASRNEEGDPEVTCLLLVPLLLLAAGDDNSLDVKGSTFIEARGERQQFRGSPQGRLSGGGASGRGCVCR